MDNIKYIPLSKGKFAIIDVDDYDNVIQYKWHYVETKHKCNDKISAYARRTLQGKKQFLHRFLLNAPHNIMVDHKNGNGLDCRRINLRFATQQQNMWNRNNKLSSTTYRSVRQVKNKYRAYINHNYKQIHLGYYDTAEEAARAHDAKALELRGEFAILNFPND